MKLNRAAKPQTACDVTLRLSPAQLFAMFYGEQALYKTDAGQNFRTVMQQNGVSAEVQRILIGRWQAMGWVRILPSGIEIARASHLNAPVAQPKVGVKDLLRAYMLVMRRQKAARPANAYSYFRQLAKKHPPEKLLAAIPLFARWTKPGEYGIEAWDKYFQHVLLIGARRTQNTPV